jgi:hypothetical protein
MLDHEVYGFGTEACRFTVPPAVALLNYTVQAVVNFGGFFAKLEFSQGFLNAYTVSLISLYLCPVFV